jgi:phosphoglycerate dehydrogenase-like enzyme/glyoxylase-like metal-dependent hydrolase (beta-lactamase superfamily II)
MRQRLLPPLLVIVSLSFGAAAALLREPPQTRDGDFITLVDGVYFRHGELSEHGHCNNGVVLFKDFVLVVDGNFPSGAEACLADLRKVTEKPARFVFDTHHHGDHAYGNPVWMQNGTIPVAHEKVVEEMARYEPKRWQEAAASRPDVKRLGRDAPLPPVVTYPDRMVLDDGTRRVELLHFGTAHTRGDGFAYLPAERILFTGDVVVNGPYNYMGDGHTGSWLKVLDALAELKVEIVVPGHGECGGPELIADQRAYIVALRRAVEDGIDAGRTLAELQETLAVPERLQRYVGVMFKDQVAKVHAELVGLEMPLELQEIGFQEDRATARPPESAPPQKVVVAGDTLDVKALERVAPGVRIVAAKGREAVLREVEDADALVGGISAEVIARGKKLRWVHSISAGVEEYVGIGTERSPGIRDLVASNVVLTNGRRCYGPPIADQVMAYLLSLTRRVKSSIEGRLGAPDRVRWEAIRPEEPKVELRGKTMVIVGAGGIGSQVAERAAAFGMHVIVVDPELPAAPRGAHALRRPDDLRSVLRQAEVLVVACPLTSKTKGLIGREEIALLPSGAYLINVARGRILDHDALVEALQSRKLAGAGLDVTEPEPLGDSSPLWKLDNVIITPHNAARSEGATRRVFLLVRENVRRFAKGEPLLNVVDKGKGF